MPSLMLVNPAKRRRARKASPARKRAARRPAARRRNPTTAVTVRRRARRHVARVAPHSKRRVVRRRRNPISMRSLNSNSLMKIVKQAAIGGGGSIAMDMLMGYVRKYLPPSLQPSATGPGLYDALYVVAAVLVGKGLSKSTKGLSEQMAAGALTVQAARLMAPFVAQMVPTQAASVAGHLGYQSANRIIPGNARVSPMMNAYNAPGGRSPLLNGRGMGAYNRPGGPSPLLAEVPQPRRAR